MVLVQVIELKYHCNPATHTVEYAKYCQQLSELTKANCVSLFAACLAPDRPTAIQRLKVRIQDKLQGFWYKPQAEDFTFRVSHAEVDPEGFVDAAFTLSDCHDYRLTAPPPAKKGR